MSSDVASVNIRDMNLCRFQDGSHMSGTQVIQGVNCKSTIGRIGDTIVHVHNYYTQPPSSNIPQSPFPPPVCTIAVPQSNVFINQLMMLFEKINPQLDDTEGLHVKLRIQSFFTVLDDIIHFMEFHVVYPEVFARNESVFRMKSVECSLSGSFWTGHFMFCQCRGSLTFLVRMATGRRTSCRVLSD